jgi:hypothetical protein
MGCFRIQWALIHSATWPSHGELQLLQEVYHMGTVSSMLFWRVRFGAVYAWANETRMKQRTFGRAHFHVTLDKCAAERSSSIVEANPLDN